jgi:hypothetical protein
MMFVLCILSCLNLSHSQPVLIYESFTVMQKLYKICMCMWLNEM